MSEDITNKIKEAGVYLRNSLNEGLKLTLDSELPQAQKNELTDSINQIEKAIATQNLDSILNVMKNFNDTNSK